MGVGVFGGTGVNEAAIVGVETIVGVGVCVGALVGSNANAGADLTGSGVGSQDGSQPRRQRTEGLGVGVGVGVGVGGGDTDASASADCQYQSLIVSPAREIIVPPPTKTRNDPRSSLNIARLLCGVVIQGGGLRNPFAASILMSWLSRSIIATPTKSISNMDTKKKAPLDCQTATKHITATVPIFHNCPGGLNRNLRIESTAP